MAREREDPTRQETMREEVEGVGHTAPTPATKSQTKGAAFGMFPGIVVGAFVGAILGLLFFEGATGVIIFAVVLAVAGGVFGAVSGGITRSMKKERSTRGVDV
jgi:predicted lipid-binding transport protein (Tim44 family)